MIMRRYTIKKLKQIVWVGQRERWNIEINERADREKSHCWLQNVLEEKNQATHWKAEEYIQSADRDRTNECPR